VGVSRGPGSHTIACVQPNPFQPPADFPGAPPAPQSYELYSPGQVLLAGFLGTPVAACTLLFLNHRRQGRASRGTWFLIVGIAMTLMLVLGAWALPDSFGRFFPLATLLAIWQLSRLDQPLFDAHLAAGGRKASTWKAVGLSVLTTIAFLAVVIPAVIAPELLANNVVDFGNEQNITYEDGATEVETRALGAHLVEIGFFNGRGKDVQLKKKGDGYVVGFVVGDKTWDDPEMVRSFGLIRDGIATAVFRGKPVTVELCDAYLEVKKTIGPP
jgi:hypothetical protein